MHFVGNCTVGTYESINAMRDVAREITWRTFRRHVPKAYEFFTDQGGLYGATHSAIEESPFFAFYKSVYEGRPCYYACWSGYEWIWV